MNIMCTGTNGFIGKTVVSILKQDNFIIGCGTKDKTESDVDLYFRWDIGHEPIPEELLPYKVDALIHIASNKNTDDLDLELSYTNIIGTHRVINFCIRNNVKKAILLSSVPVLGWGVRSEKIKENNPYAPKTMYHATKVAQELMFEQLNKYGIQVVVLRLPSPIAPAMNHRTIFTIFGNAAIKNEDIILNGKGTRRQNYIDTRDVGFACRDLLMSDNSYGIYNIGSEITVSNVELAERWKIIADSKSRIVFSGMEDTADEENWDIDLSRLKKDIGFVQRIKIEQTMREWLAQNMRSNNK